MKTNKSTKQISKFLSLVLRHQPQRIGITLDQAAWTSVPDLITKMNEKGFDINFEILI